MHRSQRPSGLSFVSHPPAPLIACVLLTLTLCGCTHFGLGVKPEKQLVIPEFPSAQEQYRFATLFKDATIPAVDKNRRREQLNRLSQCYERVVRQFPDDPTYTPLARLEIADAARAAEEPRNALRQYQEILADYPENEYVQARALYSIGRTLDDVKEYEEAKSYYRRVHDEFVDSSSPAVRDIVKRADRLYYSIRETKKPRKRG